jgi:hypothetical protein
MAANEAQALANAKIAEADAKAMEQKTDFEQMKQLREGEAVMGSLRVNMGASGGRTDVGTNFLIQMQQADESELDNFLIGLEGRTQVSKYRSEAAQQKIQAKYYAKAGKNARIGGLLGAGSAILGGAGMMSKMDMFSGGKTGAGLSGWGSHVVKSPGSTWGQGVRPPTT